MNRFARRTQFVARADDDRSDETFARTMRRIATNALALSLSIARRRSRAFSTTTTSERDALESLTTTQRARRAVLLTGTAVAAAAYVGHFTTPLLADGTARSCAALARSGDGFMAQTGAERSGYAWALGDVGGMRAALIAEGALDACVGIVCREKMDDKARLVASETLKVACEDARAREALAKRREELSARARAYAKRRGLLRRRVELSDTEGKILENIERVLSQI